jgi:Uma2 family endonuclease
MVMDGLPSTRIDFAVGRWHRLMMGRKTQLTYDDFAALPDDGKHYELLAGVLYVNPSPGLPHQHAAKRAFFQICAYFEGNGLGEVFFAPFDVILSDHDVAEPDIIVVAGASQFSRRGVEGPPALVVEVISPSSRRYDRVTKAARYLTLGVEHYWIIDPESKHLVCQRAEHGEWVVVAEGRERDTVCDPSWPDFTITLKELWHPRSG